MSEVRYNNSVGQLGAPMGASDTSITFTGSPGWATLSTGDIIKLVIDPTLGSATPSPNPLFEIVYVTAYTGSASTATVSRGEEGTTAQAHAINAIWVNGATAADFTVAGPSGPTGPTGPTGPAGPSGPAGPTGATGPGSTLDVTDGVTSVTAATEIDFTSGHVVTNAGGGVAQVALSTSVVTASSDPTAAGQVMVSNGTSSNQGTWSDPGTVRYDLHVPALTPAAAVATSNISSLSGLATVDGYTLLATDLVLLTAQTTASQNGLWQAASGSWTRPTEFPDAGLVKGRTCAVINGTTNAKTVWLLQTNSTITIDTTSQTWVQVGGASGGGVTSFNTRTGAVTQQVSDIQGALAPGGYSQDAHPFPQVDSIALLDRFRKGYNSPELGTTSTGINEFDLAYVGGTYYLAYTDYQKTILVHASTDAALTTATADGSVGVTSGTPTALWPSIAWDGTNWHLWVFDQVTNFVNHYFASTWTGLLSASVNDSWSFSKYADPQVRWNPTDGKWYAGYTNVNPYPNDTIGMLVATSPNGPWTDLGATYASLPPFASVSCADPCPVFWNGRAYMMHSAYDGTNCRMAIVELDPSNSMQAIGSPVAFVSPLESWQQVTVPTLCSPIFLARPDRPGQDRIYYSQRPGSATTAGWGYVQAEPAPSDGRRQLDLVRYDGTSNFDNATGINPALISGATYGPNGLSVSSSSAAAGRLAAYGPAGDFTAGVVFNASSLPSSGNYATLLMVSTSNGSVNPAVAVWINNHSGTITLYVACNGSTHTLALTGTTTISTSTTYRVTLRRENGTVALYLNGHLEGSGTMVDSLAALSYWAAGVYYWSGIPTQEPFTGTILSALVMGEAIPLSQV